MTIFVLDIDFTDPSSDQLSTSSKPPPSGASPPVNNPTPSSAVPSALHSISQHDPNDEQCITVHHHSNSGDILLGCADGMKIYGRQCGEVTHVVSYPAARVTEYRGEVFLSSWRSGEETVTVYKYDMNSKRSEMLFSFPHKSNLAYF